MRDSLTRWIRDADAAHHLGYFEISEGQLELAHIRSQADDYYISLVGELFNSMRSDVNTAADWARLGNAFAQFVADDAETMLSSARVLQAEAALCAAAAFYYGGFPASASLTARTQRGVELDPESAIAACFDLLSRPTVMRSNWGETVRSALRRGDMGQLDAIGSEAVARASNALAVGPEEWIPARLVEKLIGRFLRTNLRAVLPDGSSPFWTPLVVSLVDRFSWEFFPSQIEAIESGLLDRQETFSLQMPTGAGKTALCETLLYRYAKTTTETVAVLVVPYRSLASELRGSLVKRLNSMGIASRCAYGGTVPTGEEVQALHDARVMVATPEALSGILSADPMFLRRINLLICDEGHLLDSSGRGVSLELLLARMRARDGGPPRFVFVSAIVPNIEEVNAWLGGSPSTVVRSDYRPAVAEFAVLRPTGNGATLSIGLEMHPHDEAEVRYTIAGFLKREDFHWLNPTTNRMNTYSFSSIKTQAIAAARKTLPMGVAAIFCANKRGKQGAIGLAFELINQLEVNLSLPRPVGYSNAEEVAPVTQYVEEEYGADWAGSKALRVGSVLHHGDIPQETREVLEGLLRSRHVRLAICTSTLAEGVNLPIRTLVLYSVQRRSRSGRPENLLARDIKNLVGRAGRAGATTKGLVICANPVQWTLVEPAAKQLPGEAVTGALRALIEQLVRRLARGDVTLSNEVLEASPVVHALIDGVDATIIDLAAEEVGEDELVRLARQVSDDTFAARQATHEASREFLRNVFQFRARRIIEIRTSGRLEWIRETGARVRMLDSVESGLLPLRDSWDDITDPIEPELVDLMLEWAWKQQDLRQAVHEAFRLKEGVEPESVRPQFNDVVTLWLKGERFVTISESVNLSIDDLLGVHTRAVAFILQTLAEQATALLARLVESYGGELADAVRQFPEHLRFGVPTEGARVLASHGLRHRRAAIELGVLLPDERRSADRGTVLAAVRGRLEEDRDEWEERLGLLIFERTLQDLS